MIQSNPDAYGEKGSDLLKKLQELQRNEPSTATHHDHVTDHADKAIEDADKWMRQGKLDPKIVSHTKRLLTPLADQHHYGLTITTTTDRSCARHLCTSSDHPAKRDGRGFLSYHGVEWGGR